MLYKYDAVLQDSRGVVRGGGGGGGDGLRGHGGLGLAHGHRLLGQEVRLHVGRRQQRHVRPQGAPGNTNIPVNSEEWIVKARVDKEKIMMVRREEDPITMLPNDGNSMALKTQIL